MSANDKNGLANPTANPWRIVSVALLITGGLFVSAAPAQAECYQSDGTSPSGRFERSADQREPHMYVYPGSDSGRIGARYNSCDAALRLFYSGEPVGYDTFNISYGQKPASQGQNAIFSHQYEVSKDEGEQVFDTRPREVPVIAFFRAQACDYDVIGGSDCTPWSATLVVDLGNNELTRY